MENIALEKLLHYEQGHLPSDSNKDPSQKSVSLHDKDDDSFSSYQKEIKKFLDTFPDNMAEFCIIRKDMKNKIFYQVNMTRNLIIYENKSKNNPYPFYFDFTQMQLKKNSQVMPYVSDSFYRLIKNSLKDLKEERSYCFYKSLG